MADLSQLADIPTTKQIVDDFWQAVNVPAGKIRSNGLANQLVYGMAIACSGLWGVSSKIVRGLGDLRTSGGAWLDAIAKGYFDLERTLPAPTIGQISVSIPSGSPVSAITLQNMTTGVQYTWSGTPVSGPQTLQFQAQTAGSIGNCNLADLTVITPNVTITMSGGISTEWIHTNGTDDELDTSLQQRCFDVVAANSNGVSDSIAAKIRLLTKQQVSRVFIRYMPPNGPSLSGRIRCYIAGPAGPAPGYAYSTALANMPLLVSPALSAVCDVLYATQSSLVLSGTLSFQQGTSPSTATDIKNRLAAWINSLPMVTDQNDGNVLILSDITRQLNLIDSGNVLRYAQFTASCNGVRATQMTDVVLASPGSIYVANLDNLTVALS